MARTENAPASKAAPKGLGKGLDDLFGLSAADAAAAVTVLPIHQLEPNPNQPRKRFDEDALGELAGSIARHGIITPLAVRDDGGGRYIIVAGERRYRAARIAGLQEVPVHVLNTDDALAMELALVENLQRADLNPIEEAEGFQQLIDRYGLRQEDVAERVGRSRSAVANALRLLHLPPLVRALVVSGALSAGHARTLLPLNDEEDMMRAAARVRDEELSVRQTERLVQALRAAKDTVPSAAAQRSAEAAVYASALSRRVSDKLGRGVEIRARGKKKGHVLLEYYSLEDLDALLLALCGGSASDLSV